MLFSNALHPNDVKLDNNQTNAFANLWAAPSWCNSTLHYHLKFFKYYCLKLMNQFFASLFKV